MEDIKNKTTGEKLSDSVKQLKRRVERSQEPALIMIYCASHEEDFEGLTKYIGKQLNIEEKDYLTIELGEQEYNLTDVLLTNKELEKKIRYDSGDIILIKVKGYEKQLGLESITSYRIAHDYDQDTKEDFEKNFLDLQKKIIVVTHIGYSKGEEYYQKAVASVAFSQHKDFFYQI